MWLEGVLYVEENQSMVINLCGYLLLLLCLRLVYLRLTLMGGYGITDCGIKWGECPVGRGLSVDLAVVMTEYGCSSVSCV